VGQVASLITQKLKEMGEGGDWHLIRSKHKAITALLPYAVQQEADGQAEMFNKFLDVARDSKDRRFTWFHIRHYSIPYDTSSRALVLISPYIRWDQLTDREYLIQRWAAAAFEVPRTEEVAQSVVDTLLQIASQGELLPHIPIDMWPWLTKRPTLPPICLGRNIGTCAHVVKAVRALSDIEILKSYFFLVWSEWNHFSSESSDDVSGGHLVSIPRRASVR